MRFVALPLRRANISEFSVTFGITGCRGLAAGLAPFVLEKIFKTGLF